LADLQGFKKGVGSIIHKKPIAFVGGQGMWTLLKVPIAEQWIDEINNATLEMQPHLGEPGAFWPRLFLPPNACGFNKPTSHLAQQGNVMLARFERAMAVKVKERGMDFLGTWNATIQSTMFDGT
jgi:hypothetical protein